MLNEDELNLLADIFQDRFSDVSAKIICDIGETLKKTGELTPSQAKKLQQMYSYGMDLNLINRQLENASGKSFEDIQILYEAVAQEESDWANPFYEAKGITQIPLSGNPILKNIINSAAITTGNTLKNLSNTTLIGVNTADGFQDLDTFYKKTMDNAITSVATGVEDYNSAIRQAVKDLGNGGLRVQYASGYTKRLDSAVRQNVLDGISYVAQEIAAQNGREFGSDGVELSAHSPCAPDHLPYQGKQFSNDAFEKLQSSLKRPIGEWNCRHIPFPIIVGISHPANTQEELTAMERYSNEKIEIDGNNYTRYECSQIQRQLETKMRYVNDEKSLYKTIDDKELIRGADEKLRALRNKYAEVSQKAGLRTKAERTRVVSDKLRSKRVEIQAETLPKGKNITIPTEKFTKYVLNKEKSYDKAVAFEKALGYNINSSDKLIAEIRKNARRFPSVEKPDTGYGRRYEVLMTLTGPNGKQANIKTAWILDKETDELRLTSAYITSKKRKEGEN